jgi:hypothetical protein
MAADSNFDGRKLFREGRAKPAAAPRSDLTRALRAIAGRIGHDSLRNDHHATCSPRPAGW